MRTLYKESEIEWGSGNPYPRSERPWCPCLNCPCYPEGCGHHCGPGEGRMWAIDIKDENAYALACAKHYIKLLEENFPEYDWSRHKHMLVDVEYDVLVIISGFQAEHLSIPVEPTEFAEYLLMRNKRRIEENIK